MIERQQGATNGWIWLYTAKITVISTATHKLMFKKSILLSKLLPNKEAAPSPANHWFFFHFKHYCPHCSEWHTWSLLSGSHEVSVQHTPWHEKVNARAFVKGKWDAIKSFKASFDLFPTQSKWTKEPGLRKLEEGWCW